MSLELKNNAKIALLVGSGLLIFQNFILFINNLGDYEDDEFLFNTIVALDDADLEYIIDILGFLALGVAFILAAAERSDKTNYYIVGVGSIAWALLRIVWQFILLDLDEIDPFSDEDVFFDSEVTVFLIANILLFVGLLYLYFMNKDNRFLLAYTVTNLVSSVFIFITMHSETFDWLESWDEDLLMWLSFKLKLIISPLIAMVAFGYIIKPYAVQSAAK